jgi:hypothetical protein
MAETNQTEVPATEAPQDLAQTSDTKADPTSTAKASDELSEDDLDAVAGGQVQSLVISWKPPNDRPY